MPTSETHTNVIEGHPIHTYFVETDLIHQLLEELNPINPKDLSGISLYRPCRER